MLNAWQIFIQKRSYDEFFLRLPLTGDGADCRVPHPFAAIGRGSEWALPTRWLVEMAADSLSWILSQAQLLQLSVDQYHSVSRCCSIVKMGTQPGRIFTGMSRMGEFWPIAARRRSIPPQYGTEMRDGGARGDRAQHCAGLISVPMLKPNISNILISQSSSSQEGALTTRLNDILPETWLQFYDFKWSWS